jgi:hypothetical protein
MAGTSSVETALRRSNFIPHLPQAGSMLMSSRAKTKRPPGNRVAFSFKGE